MKLIKAYVFAMLLTGCLPAGGTYGGTSYHANPVVATTGVYVNGQELSVADKAKLEWLLGSPVPSGNYFVTDAGMMGIVGQQATINLVAYAEARGLGSQQASNARSSSHYNGHSGDAITSQGGCTIVSSGSTSYSSGC